jgi:hypothetical protein
MAERVLDANTFPAALAEVIVDWPLYRRLTFKGDVSIVTIGTGRERKPVVNLPEEVEKYCEQCRQLQRWRLGHAPNDFDDFELPQMQTVSGETRTLRFICKNCEAALTVFLKIDISPAGVSEIVKVGQYPALELEPPPILASAMTKEDLILYRHALTCRNSTFGIGAVGYLRRIVENQINDLLDLIADAAHASDPESPLLARLAEMKGKKRFADKIDYAAEMLPKTIRRGGHNPIATLHDLASDGLHNKSDDECVDIFDGCKLAFEYVITRLREDHDEDAAYQEAMKALAAKKARKKT